MTAAHMLDRLQEVQRLATTSKVQRMLHHPGRYLGAILFRQLIHRRTKATRAVSCRTFFDVEMTLLLPSGTDIYLTGGKSHDSEIRLAKYMIGQLAEGDTFIDVGAHYGYFSLLASTLVGSDGQVLALEAAPKTYQVLEKNSTAHSNIRCRRVAISDKQETLTFYEFPNMYSEYNTLLPGQYEDQQWYEQHKPTAVEVQALPLSTILEDDNLLPSLIKVDVEGAEHQVVLGLLAHLQIHSPAIVLEYVSEARGNEQHQQAESLLIGIGYKPHSINDSGAPVPIDSASAYIQSTGTESDNIVFIRNSKRPSHRPS